MSTRPTAAGDVQRIVLTGFMGSGKTTVGRALAARLGWRFADLDDAVEALEGRSVPEIFAEAGEPAFRLAETEALKRLLQETELVIALGGGAPETAANADLLRQSRATPVIYLQAPLDLLYERCAAQALDRHATRRPLLGERERTQERYERRHSLYRAIAQGTVDASPSPAAVALSVSRVLGLT